MKAFRAYAALRAARTAQKLVGIRLKKSKEEKKPAADALVGYQANVLAAKVQEAALAGGRVELPADIFNL